MTEQWVKDLATVMNPYTLEISIGLLILLWLGFFIRYHLYLIKPIIKELENFSSFVFKLSNLEEQNESLISKYLSDLNNKSVLNPIWKDYIKNRDAEPELEPYFNEVDMIDIPAKREQSESIPSFLFGIGIVASFFCLLFSFAALPEGADLSTNLYPTISEAILVVIFAILLSYLFGLLTRSSFRKAKTSVAEIQRLLNRKILQAKNDNRFEYISTAINDMTSSLTNYAMLLYLPGYVVIDSEKDKDTSYLYKSKAFNIDNLANLSLNSEIIVSMKDAILENERSDIYELNYEGLGKLYIRDYLEMIL